MSKKILAIVAALTLGLAGLAGAVVFGDSETVELESNLELYKRPQRIFDSRIQGLPLAPDNVAYEWSLDDFGIHNVRAAVLQVTLVGVWGEGYIEWVPGVDVIDPTFSHSNGNWTMTSTSTDQVTVPVVNGKVTAYLGGSGAVHVVIDVVGIYPEEDPTYQTTTTELTTTTIGEVTTTTAPTPWAPVTTVAPTSTTVTTTSTSTTVAS